MSPRILAILLVTAALISVMVYTLSTPDDISTSAEIPAAATPFNGMVGDTTAAAVGKPPEAALAVPAPAGDVAVAPPAAQLSGFTDENAQTLTNSPQVPGIIPYQQEAPRPEAFPPPN